MSCKDYKQPKTTNKDIWFYWYWQILGEESQRGYKKPYGGQVKIRL